MRLACPPLKKPRKDFSKPLVHQVEGLKKPFGGRSVDALDRLSQVVDGLLEIGLLLGQENRAAVSTLDIPEGPAD